MRHMRMKYLKNLAITLSVVLAIFVCGCGDSDNSVEDLLQAVQAGQPAGPAPVLSFRIVNTFPHQTNAFTQGLLFSNGVLYESTGLVGQSSLREVDLTTGQVLRQQNNAANLFAEGLALRAGVLFQLTLSSGQAMTWDRTTFNQTGTVTVPNPSWGLTLTDQDRFAHSDGTSTLRFLLPNSMQEVRRVTVTDNGQPVNLLNELEFINGFVYANRFTTDEIVAIDPATGVVRFRVNLAGIIDKQANGLGVNDVLNGIAYDSAQNRLFVTGKNWPSLFEIEIVQ